MDLTSVTPDLAGLKALSHPVRLRMLGMLRLDGPATATSLARRLGLNTGATSYHLRQLEKHGFIEDDADRGDARERWWRARHQSTRTSEDDATTPEDHETHDAYLQAVVIGYTALLQAAVEERSTLEPAWRRAGTFSDWRIRLTPERARALVQRLEEVVEEVEEDGPDVAGALPFAVNLNAFREPGIEPGAEPGAEAGIEERP